MASSSWEYGCRGMRVVIFYTKQRRIQLQSKGQEAFESVWNGCCSKAIHELRLGGMMSPSPGVVCLLA